MKTKYKTLLKSNNALRCEENFSFTILKMNKKNLSDFLKYENNENGVNLNNKWNNLLLLKNKELRALVELSHNGEWHHIGKFAKKVNYYDFYDVINFCENNKNWKDLINKKLNKKNEIEIERVKGTFKTFYKIRGRWIVEENYFEGKKIGSWIYLFKKFAKKTGFVKKSINSENIEFKKF